MTPSQSHNLGRLVMVVEPKLTEATRYALHQLMVDMESEDITMLTTLGKPATMDANRMHDGIFYNAAEHLSLGTACSLMPWREMWLVSNGRVWKATPYQPDEVMAND